MTRTQKMIAEARKMLNAKNGNTSVYYHEGHVGLRLTRSGGNVRPGAVRSTWWINGEQVTAKQVDQAA